MFTLNVHSVSLTRLIANSLSAIVYLYVIPLPPLPSTLAFVKLGRSILAPWMSCDLISYYGGVV